MYTAIFITSLIAFFSLFVFLLLLLALFDEDKMSDRTSTIVNNCALAVLHIFIISFLTMLILSIIGFIWL